MRDASPSTLVAFIRGRVEQWPNGRIRSRVDKLRRETHAALWDRSARIATGLLHVGATSGRPVVLLTRDVLDFVPAFWGCLRCGAMAVPLSGAALLKHRDHTDATLAHALTHLERPVILFDAYFAKAAKALRLDIEATFLPLAQAQGAPPLGSDRAAADPICLLPTSGSTGRLKLAALSQGALLYRCLAVARPASATPTARLSLLPVDGVSGLWTALLVAQNQFHLPIATFAADPLLLLDSIEQSKITELAITNSLVAVLLREAEGAEYRWDLSRLSFIFVGAEPIVPSVMRRLRDLLARHGAPNAAIVAGYGTTETGLLAGGANPLDARSDEVSPIGSCVAGVALRIVGEGGETLPDGQIGQVQAYRPEAMFSGYWGEPETAETSLTADGWWRTGDLGLLVDGVLTLHGRAKEILIINGRKYSLVDIDAHLQSNFSAEVRAYSCAVHEPGAAGERLAVVFVCRAGHAGAFAVAEDRIRALIGSRFGIQAWPLSCSDDSLLPLTGSGKIRRSELASRVLSGFYGDKSESEPSPQPGSSIDPIETQVARVWRETLDISGLIDPNADFFALGGDSLRAMRLSSRIEDVVGCQVAPDEFFQAPTLATLLRLVSETMKPDRKNVDTDRPHVAWPLPAALRHQQLSIIESWDGVRPTRDRLVAGLNTRGARAPLFFVCQSGKEFRQLADQLGHDQPIYALRSGAELISYTENDIQALALRYAEEIEEVCHNDTVFVGGICQGGIIALAIAQHLQRRGRHVALLVLIEWSFTVQSYGGKVLFIHGKDSRDNPRRLYQDPEAVWRHSFANCQSVEVPGSHFVLRPGSANIVSDILKCALKASEAEPPWLLKRKTCRIELINSEPIRHMHVGETRNVDITVRNLGRFPWLPKPVGLILQNAWIDAEGTVVKNVDGRMTLPLIDPGGSHTISLPVTAPNVSAPLNLIVDVVDEGKGRAWQGNIESETLCLDVNVIGET